MTSSNQTFKRFISDDLIRELKKEELFNNYLLPDIEKGVVFPAIRNQRVDFYYKGGKLFEYNEKGFKTHIKYAAVIEKQNKDYLTESELDGYTLSLNFFNSYERIKENCKNYSGNEASGISAIYEKNSYPIKSTGIVVLDIEVSLKSDHSNKTQNRIDILVYNIDERTLRFVEGKHYSNSDIWSRKKANAIKQVKDYEKEVNKKKPMLLEQYNQYIDIVNGLFNLKLYPVKKIDDKVTLLIFGFDGDQEKGRLKQLVTNNNFYINEEIKTYRIGSPARIKLANMWEFKRQ